VPTPWGHQKIPTGELSKGRRARGLHSQQAKTSEILLALPVGGYETGKLHHLINLAKNRGRRHERKKGTAEKEVIWQTYVRSLLGGQTERKGGIGSMKKTLSSALKESTRQEKKEPGDGRNQTKGRRGISKRMMVAIGLSWGQKKRVKTSP